MSSNILAYFKLARKQRTVAVYRHCKIKHWNRRRKKFAPDVRPRGIIFHRFMMVGVCAIRSVFAYITESDVPCLICWQIQLHHTHQLASKFMNCKCFQSCSTKCELSYLLFTIDWMWKSLILNCSNILKFRFFDNFQISLSHNKTHTQEITKSFDNLKRQCDYIFLWEDPAPPIVFLSKKKRTNN